MKQTISSRMINVVIANMLTGAPCSAGELPSTNLHLSFDYPCEIFVLSLLSVNDTGPGSGTQGRWWEIDQVHKWSKKWLTL